MSDFEGFKPASDCERIVDTLRHGGIACFLPSLIASSALNAPDRIKAAWRDFPNTDSITPPLARFPVSVCFTDLPHGPYREQCNYFVNSCYWFAPATYQENETTRQMSYFTQPASRYRLVITHRKAPFYSPEQERWEGHKVRGDEVVYFASENKLIDFVIEFTRIGVQSDELYVPMMDRAESASTMILVERPESAEDYRLIEQSGNGVVQ